MELGTAIFLSVTLLCLLAVVISFKDKIRWNIVFLTLLSFAALVGLSVYVLSLPIVWRGTVTELDGMKLGDSESDLLFRRGESYQSRCEISSEKGLHRTYIYKSSSPYQNYTDIFDLLNGKIIKLAKYGNFGTVYWPNRNSLSVYDDETRVIEKLGSNFVQLDRPDLSREYEWPQYHLNIIMTRSRLSGIEVRDPRFYAGDKSAFTPNDDYKCGNS